VLGLAAEVHFLFISVVASFLAVHVCVMARVRYSDVVSSPLKQIGQVELIPAGNAQVEQNKLSHAQHRATSSSVVDTMAKRQVAQFFGDMFFSGDGLLMIIYRLERNLLIFAKSSMSKRSMSQRSSIHDLA
jgi:hypothetical protein